MNHELENLPLDRMLQVDAACDRFDKALLTSAGMSIEELLATVPNDLRFIVLREAIRMETETRSGRGDNPSTEEYVNRFPELRQEMDGLVSLSDQSSLPREASATLTLPGNGDSSLSFADGSSLTNTSLLHLVPGNTFGRYRIERMLGRGGMGVVYLATDVRLNRQVALKFPRFVDDPLLAQRFEREARTMASVSHRNLCSIFDVNEAEGIHYLTMAYIDGLTLAQIIKQREQLSTEKIAKLFHKLSLATAFAHRAGVVHRDLKPANIMIDLDGEPVIMDFGLAIAHEEDARLTHAGVFVGTPAYMAPEQTWDDDKAVGTWSDIYSLGAILYELLCGRNVFQGSASQVISQLVQGATPQPPHLIRPDIDRRLESICLKALAHRPEDRYESAEAMATAFREYLATPTAAVMLEANSENQQETQQYLNGVKPFAKSWIVYCGVSIMLIFGIWKLVTWQADPVPTSPGIASGTDQDTRLNSTDSNEVVPTNQPLTVSEFRKALKLEAGAYVEIDGLKLDVEGAHTMEAFVTAGIPHDRRDKHVFGWPGPSSLFLRGTSSSWAFGLSHIEQYQFIQAPNAIQVGERVHLALVRDGMVMKLFVNGKLADQMHEFQPELKDPKHPFKIGTANLQSAFVGLIDELRVSNTARYTSDFHPPQEPLATDQDTLGLYHCDEGQDSTLIDASGNNNHGRIVGGTWWQDGDELVFNQSRSSTSKLNSNPGTNPTKKIQLARRSPDGYALEFDGKNSYVHIPTLSRNDAKPVTFEMWICANIQKKECLVGVLSGQEYLQVNQDANKVLTFDRHMADLVPDDRQPILPGDWTHVATVVDGDEVRLYINGRKASARTKSRSSLPYSFDGTWLGAHPYKGEICFHFAGQLDEIRISNSIRYRDDFQPETRFVSDENTLALFHCDEGSGEQLHDSSTHGNHGTVNEVRWHLHRPPSPAGLRTAIAPLGVEEVHLIQSEWAKHLNVPVTQENSIGMSFQLIPPGAFLMGADANDDEAQAHESPQHVVRITRPFQLSAHEVSVDMFRKFVESESYITEAESDGMGGYDAQTRARTPEYVWSSRESANGALPVTNVSYADAMRFCDWLTQKEDRKYRLPTEAEWEYACRGGSQTRYYFGDQYDPAQANAATRESVGRIPCGKYPANPFGLFDMHGNVHEICLDSGRTYTLDAATDPVGEIGDGAEAAVVRGGAFGSSIVRLRSSNRYLTDRRKFPEIDFANISKGFRVLREIEAK